jgi:hypothetical protein
MPYSKTAIATALRASSRVWAFRYERISKTGQVLSSEDVVSCSVANNSLADTIKRTCKVELPRATTFDYLQHSLRAYARLLMPDGDYQEWCMGTFLLAQPSRDVDTVGKPISTDGYDWLLKLTEAKSSARVASTDFAGVTTYYGLITSLLSAAGFTSANIAYDTRVLPTPFEWEPGTSYLQMINDLLAGLNFTPLVVDAFGVPTSKAYVDPGKASPIWQYVRDNTSVIIDESTIVELDVFDLPNQWSGDVSEPEQTPLVYVKTNAEPSSPYSTVNRGRIITRVLTSQELGKPADLASLQAIVDRIAAEASQQYEQIEFSTGLMPLHGDSDALDVDTGAGLLRYREHSWEVQLRAVAVMKHVARRAVTL